MVLSSDSLQTPLSDSVGEALKESSLSVGVLVS